MGRILKVLHLESNNTDVKLVSLCIGDAGFNQDVLQVKNLAGFKHALIDFCPDVILSDLISEDITWQNALELSRECGKNIPFIIISNEATSEFIVHAVKSGVENYLLKNSLTNLPEILSGLSYGQVVKAENTAVPLRAEERFYANVLSSLNLEIAVIDEQGTLLSVNKAWQKFKDSNSPTCVTTATGSDNYFAACENAIKEGDVIAEQALSGIKSVLLHELPHFELEYPCHSPTEQKWFVLRANEFDSDNSKVVVYHQDITAKKLAEEQVLTFETKLRRLVENSADGIAILGENGKPLYVSPSIINILGYTTDEAMDLDMFNLTHLEDIPVFSEFISNSLAIPGEPFKGNPIRVKHKSGNWVWIDGVLINMLHDPVINGIIANFRDVTEQIVAEKILKDSEEKYRSIFDCSVDGILLTIKNGEILSANKAACEIFQMSEAEICAAGSNSLIDVTDPRLHQLLEQREVTGQAKGEVVFKRKDGNTFPGEISSSVFMDSHGIEKTTMLVRDISEKTSIEKKLKHANRLYSFLSQINQAIVHINDEQVLYQEACRIAVEYGKFQMAWIGKLDASTATIRLQASFGADIEEEKLFSNYKYDVDGSIAKVIQGLEYCVVNEMPIGKKVMWDTIANHHGYKSALVLPINKAGILVGTFNIYSLESGFFNSDEIKLLKEAAEDISFALEIFEKDRLRTAVENNLFQSETKLSTAQRIARLGYWEADLKSGTLYWSDEVYNIWGNSKNDFKPDMESFIKSIHPDDREDFLNHQAIAIKKLEVLDAEHRILLANGTVKWVHEKGQIKNDIQGNPILFEGTVQDITEQKNSLKLREEAEKALRESNTRYELVSKATLDAIWDWNLITGELYWNEGFETLFGYKLADMMPDLSSRMAHFHPDDFDEIVSGINQTINGIQNNWQASYRYKKANGDYAYVVDRGFVIRDENNNAIRMVGAMRDVTEKRNLENLLDKATSLAKIGSYEADLVKGKHYWSPIILEILELPSDFVPQTGGILNFLDQPSKQIFSNAFKKTIESNIPYDLELKVITAKGNEVWVRDIGESECIDGKCIRVYGSFQNIDTIKKAELELLKIYEEKNLILESIDDAFFAVDKNWVITYWNNKAEIILGFKRDDVLGKTLWDIYPIAVETNFYNYYNKAVNENEVQHFESHHAPLGVWFEVSAYPSKHGLSVYFKDITQRKIKDLQLQELNKNLNDYTHQLINSNKGLEQFSYIISHNLRSPVANIMGLASELSSGDHEEEVNNVLLADLITNVQRLDTVIIDLNNILKVKSQINELKEPVSLLRLIEDIKLSIKHIVNEQHVQILTSGILVDDIFTIRSYIQSILYNLIANSIKYRRDDVTPVIQISSAEFEGKLVITFKDNGRGIDLGKYQEHVFGLYKRFHTHVEGKGMGLFMVKTQLEVLGGKISIASTINQGTEFKIEF